MEDKHPLAKGFYFDKPREGAPEFIRGRISIKVEDALKTLEEYKNDAGYVNLEVCRSKDGTKMYLQVNTYGLDKGGTQAPDIESNVKTDDGISF